MVAYLDTHPAFALAFYVVLVILIVAGGVIFGRDR